MSWSSSKPREMIVEVCSFLYPVMISADIVDSIETSAAWPRPAVPKFDKAKDSICKLNAPSSCRLQANVIAFQQIDIEEHSDPRLGPTLRLFGVTEGGNSVLAHVYGFRPYFYVAAPSGFLNKDLDPLKDTLNVRFNHLLRRGNELISRV
jgi:hypothetical protein